jgi:hypothetical protein
MACEPTAAHADDLASLLSLVICLCIVSRRISFRSVDRSALAGQDSASGSGQKCRSAGANDGSALCRPSGGCRSSSLFAAPIPDVLASGIFGNAADRFNIRTTLPQRGQSRYQRGAFLTQHSQGIALALPDDKRRCHDCGASQTGGHDLASLPATHSGRFTPSLSAYDLTTSPPEQRSGKDKLYPCFGKINLSNDHPYPSQHNAEETYSWAGYVPSRELST